MSEPTQYQWLELLPLDVPGESAAVLNRRIATHLKLRADIDAGEPLQSRLRPGVPPVTEALRRELFIRRDIVRLLHFKKLDANQAMRDLQTISDALRAAL